MTIFLLITKFLPLLIALIQMLSTMFPAAKIGSFKLAVAVKALAALSPYLAAGTIPIDQLISSVAPGLINDIVAAMNEHPETWNMQVGAIPTTAVPAA